MSGPAASCLECRIDALSAVKIGENSSVVVTSFLLTRASPKDPPGLDRRRQKPDETRSAVNKKWRPAVELWSTNHFGATSTTISTDTDGLEGDRSGHTVLDRRPVNPCKSSKQQCRTMHWGEQHKAIVFR